MSRDRRDLSYDGVKQGIAMSPYSIFWALTLATLWVVLETFEVGVLAGPGAAFVSADALAAYAWPALSLGWAVAIIRLRPRLHGGFIILGTLAAIVLAVGGIAMIVW